MPIYQLPQDEYWFPPESEYSDDIVAVGGDLNPQRLLLAYRRGIFPWYNEPGEIIWWCPEVRCVQFTDEVKISHSMRNTFNKGTFRITMDKAFTQVIEGCREGIRENATWLFDEMAEAYTALHEQGYAHSVEVWQGRKLVGGLYGLSLGHVFFGESMFSRVPNSSKAAFIRLSQYLNENGWKILDCQVVTDHLTSLGASAVSREIFLPLLQHELQYPDSIGKWNFDRKLHGNPLFQSDGE
jgi:leucyl/phenylalanyl-tRNA--protein transferase